MFLEILIVLFIQLSTAVGMPAAIGIVVVFGVAAIFLAHYVATLAAEAILGGGSRGTLSRRPTEGLPSATGAGNKKAAKLNDEELAARLAQKPRDPALVMEDARRLKQNGDLAAFARRLEFFLTLESKIELEQRCMIHHQLADLYTGPLSDPPRARQVLEAFIAANPSTIQALNMRERLQNLPPSS